ncbi:MAG: outer membrane beta-barrel protein [Holophagaceae bacterium]|nr:outer membrane beta-barrel protein [Holophagaceae bacterium]
MRPLILICLSACLSLVAQDNPGGNRMGIGLSLLSPQSAWGDLFDTGFQAGLQIHFNRESRFLSRLRIDYLQSDSKRAIQAGTYLVWNGSGYDTTPRLADSRMEAYSIAYEWLPHLEPHGRRGLFGIFGVGGTLWNETLRFRGAFQETDTEVEWGFTASAGIGWRFNPHATVEARFVNSDLSFHGHHNYNYGPSRAYLTFGTSLRF